MKDLTIEEMLALIKDLTLKHHITAYEIGENTDLNTSGVHRILAGEVLKPRIKTLKIILEYIEDKITGSNSIKKSRTSEEKALEGNNNSIQDIIAQEVFKLINPGMLEIKESQRIIINALTNQTLDFEEFRLFIEELKTSQKSNKN